jgi:hypothetical protein
VGEELGGGGRLAGGVGAAAGEVVRRDHVQRDEEGDRIGGGARRVHAAFAPLTPFAAFPALACRRGGRSGLRQALARAESHEGAKAEPELGASGDHRGAGGGVVLGWVLGHAGLLSQGEAGTGAAMSTGSPDGPGGGEAPPSVARKDPRLLAEAILRRVGPVRRNAVPSALSTPCLHVNAASLSECELFAIIPAGWPSHIGDAGGSGARSASHPPPLAGVGRIRPTGVGVQP